MPTDRPTMSAVPTLFIRGTCPHGHTQTFPAVREDGVPASGGETPPGAPVSGVTLTCAAHQPPVTWWRATPDLPPAPPGRLRQLHAATSGLRDRYRTAGARLADAIWAEISHHILEVFPTAGLAQVGPPAADAGGRRLVVRVLIDTQGHVLADGAQETAGMRTLADAVKPLLEEIAALSPGEDLRERHLKVTVPNVGPAAASRGSGKASR